MKWYNGNIGMNPMQSGNIECGTVYRSTLDWKCSCGQKNAFHGHKLSMRPNSVRLKAF